MHGTTSRGSSRTVLRAMTAALLAAIVLGSVFVRAQEDDVDPDAPKTVKIGGIDHFVDYDAAKAAAIETGKPMWLHFGENPG